MSWELRDPLLLVLLALVPVVYLAAARRDAQISFPLVHVTRGAPRSLRVRLALLPAWLFAGAAFALVIAIAGPHTGDATSQVRREGIAIVMAVDRSGSMDARDFVGNDASVSRLDAVKAVFHEFVEGGASTPGRPDDLIGLVAFGTFADGVCPLTLDHGNLLAILDGLEVATEESEAATAIGEGLGLAVERLRSSEATSKVVILLTDGVNNAGELDPIEAAELAKSLGIRVYAIGAGRNGFAPVPVRLPDGRTLLRRAWVEMDEATLQEIARRTGGRTFHAADADGLRAVYAEIDRLERSEITEVRYLQYEEHYPWFVLVALGLVAAAIVGERTVFRRLPA